MTRNLAPIVLFVYNRPWHTQQTLEALAKNELSSESILYIFADGQKENATEETISKIKETRDIIKGKLWCKEVIILEKDENKGLSNSIINGVTEVVNKHGKIIVLEDDIIVSPYFLHYMNDGLRIYENEAKVISIHAYNYPISTKDLPEVFFIKGADCWGWATWDNSWSLFEENPQRLLEEILSKELQTEFDIQNSYPYTQMLRDQCEGKVDSWAIRWYASAFLKNKFTLYPKQSIVNNIGLDGSGTHGGLVNKYDTSNWNNKQKVIVHYNEKIENNLTVLNRWKNYHLQNNEPTVFNKLSTVQKIKNVIATIYKNK